jgi:predicted MFS family arabinose efflux permease
MMIKPRARFLILPSLFLAVLVNWIPNLIIGLLLIEISQTFDVSIGVAGQLNSSSAIVSVIMCVLMGSLRAR